MSEPKTYHIETISDIANAVNADNVMNFLKDLEGTLLFFVQAKALSPDVKWESFKWIDDGKHNITIELTEK